MPEIELEKIYSIGDVLNDPKRALKERFRALFTLRNLGGEAAIKCIEKCFQDPSALLKHELAYCLGQMQDKVAIPALIRVLEDLSQEPMVRHEAAEAMGAIGSEEAIPVLKKYESDPVVEVSETCQLALGRIEWLKRKEKCPNGNPYTSVDPAPPALSADVASLKSTLLDEAAPLFERYRAMFALRNVQGKEAVLTLGAALQAGSALFRHEVAFVLGQMQDANSVPFLRAALEDVGENEMVRHECAEALGAIASEECFDVLNKYLLDRERVVRESCEVALDMCEYETSAEFQYANALTK